MGKLTDAIRDRRKRSQRRLGFGAAAEQPQPSMLVGAVGAVPGADIALAISESAIDEVAASDVELWGVRLASLTVDRVQRAKDAGAAYVAFDVDSGMADAALDEDIDYVVRLSDTRIDEPDARALATLRPTVIAPQVSFPLSLRSALDLRRLSLLTSSPLGAICPSDISAGDLQALRDAGVAAILIEAGATAEDVSSVRQLVAGLPEHKSKRDDDAQPMLPTTQSTGVEFEEE